MEANALSLTQRRRLRRDLWIFVQALLLQTESGLDLAYAWRKTFHLQKRSLGWPARALLRPRPAFAGWLAGGDARRPPSVHLWFATLSELYTAGVALGTPLESFARALLEETERDWQAHRRALPLKASLVLAFFFVLPALWLLFAPLLDLMQRDIQ